ncbi:MAG: DUF2147 domain-containing protein [Bacteroidales bacterium]
MTRIIAALSFLLFSCILNAQDLTGKWTSYKKGIAKSIVEIYLDNGIYYGKIIRLINPPDGNMHPLCIKCKGNLKNQPVVGMVIIKDMQKEGNIFAKGTILNPENGKVYSLKLSFSPNDANTLVVKGSVGPFSETQYWKRVKE